MINNYIQKTILREDDQNIWLGIFYDYIAMMIIIFNNSNTAGSVVPEILPTHHCFFPLINIIFIYENCKKLSLIYT